MGAEEAERASLVAQVVQAEKLLEEALAQAKTIAGLVLLAVKANKELGERRVRDQSFGRRAF